MIKCLIVFVASLVAVEAIVCLPGMCAKLKSKEPLHCKGSVIKDGGYCGCTDVCAKVEGELCQASFILGIIPEGICDEGLVCVKQTNVLFGKGKCVKKAAISD